MVIALVVRFSNAKCSPSSSLWIQNYLIPISYEIKHLKAIEAYFSPFNKTNHKMQVKPVIAGLVSLLFSILGLLVNFVNKVLYSRKLS